MKKEMFMNVLIVYYSMYGHIRRMAEAVKEGAGGVSGADVRIYRVRKLSRKKFWKKWVPWKHKKRRPISPSVN